MKKCKRCKSEENLIYGYKGDYYCNNNRCLNLLFARSVADGNIIVDDENRASMYDEYYNSNGKYIGDDTCTNRTILDQVPEVEKYEKR
nr:MAG TPA: hypothetical protein [Caudoviricetes sp.]